MRKRVTKILFALTICTILLTMGVCATTGTVTENFDSWTGSFTGLGTAAEKTGLSTGKFEFYAKNTGISELMTVTPVTNGSGKAAKYNLTDVPTNASGYGYFLIKPKTSLRMNNSNGSASLEFKFKVDSLANTQTALASITALVHTTEYTEAQFKANEDVTDFESIYQNDYGKWQKGNSSNIISIKTNTITVFGEEYTLSTPIAANTWYTVNLTVTGTQKYTLTLNGTAIASDKAIPTFSIRYQYNNTSGTKVAVFSESGATQFRGFGEAWMQWGWKQADVVDSNTGELKSGLGVYYDDVTFSSTDGKVDVEIETKAKAQECADWLYVDTKGNPYEGIKLPNWAKIDGATLKFTKNGSSVSAGSTLWPSADAAQEIELIATVTYEGETGTKKWNIDFPKVQPVWISGINVVDEDGNACSDIAVNSTLKSVTMRKYTTKAVSGKLIAGIYRNDVLIDVVENDFSIASGGTAATKHSIALTNQVTLPSDLEGVELRLYAFESMKTIKPVDTTVEPITTTVYKAKDNTGLDYDWDSLYLGSEGYVTGIISHPTEPKLTYARTDVGGLYKFDYDNERWHNIMYNIPEDKAYLTFVRSVGLDPNNPDIIYATGGTKGDYSYVLGGMVVSYDRGETWEDLDFGYTLNDGTRFGYPINGNDGQGRAAGENIAVDPNDSNTIFVGTWTDGLFVSRNAGRSFSKIELPNFPDFYTNVDSNGRNLGITTAASAAKDGAGGINFVVVDPSETLPNGRSKYIWVGVGGVGIYVSWDGGETFSQRNPPSSIKDSNGNQALLNPCHAQVIDGVLYVSGAMDYYRGYSGGLYKYDRHASAWTDLQADNALTDTVEASEASSTKQEGKYTGIGGFIVDGNTIVMAPSAYFYALDQSGEGRIARTTNNGNSWTIFGDDLGACGVFKDPNSETGRGFWRPHGRGVVYYEDYNTNESEIDNTTAIAKYGRDVGVEELCTNKMMSNPLSSSPDLIVACLDWGVMSVGNLESKATHKGTEAGVGGGTAVDFCEESPSIVFIAGSSAGIAAAQGNVARSENGGTSFTEGEYMGPSVTTGYLWNQTTTWPNGWQNTNIAIVDIAVSGKLGASGYPTVIVYSTGSGTSVKDDDGNKIGYEGAGFYRSTDNGATWEKLAFESPMYQPNRTMWAYNKTFLASDRATADVFYYLDKYDFYVSLDGGNTWEVTETFEKTSSYLHVKGIPGVAGGVWVCRGDGIYVSYDYGQNFTRLTDVRSADCFGFGAPNPSSDAPVAAYIVGTIDGYRGVYESDDLGETWVLIGEEGDASVGTRTPDIIGDRKEYGKVYISSNGWGVRYGEKK